MAFALLFGECHLAMTLHPPNVVTTASWQFIKVAIRYRLFEVLETGAMSLAELCVLTRVAPHDLLPILNALISLQLLVTDGRECFALTDRCDAFFLAQISERVRALCRD